MTKTQCPRCGCGFDLFFDMDSEGDIVVTMCEAPPAQSKQLPWTPEEEAAFIEHRVYPW